MPGKFRPFVISVLVGLCAALVPFTLGPRTTVEPDLAVAQTVAPTAPAWASALLYTQPVDAEHLDLEALPAVWPTPRPVVSATSVVTSAIQAIAPPAPAVAPEAPVPVVRAHRVDGPLYDTLLAAFGPARVDTAVRVALCEGGGNPAISTGNGYFGTFQFLLSTWVAMGGSGLPSNASLAEQARVAAHLQDTAGWSPWPGVASNYGGRVCG